VPNKAQHHEDVLGEWRYSFTYFLTLALDAFFTSTLHVPMTHYSSSPLPLL